MTELHGPAEPSSAPHPPDLSRHVGRRPAIAAALLGAVSLAACGTQDPPAAGPTSATNDAPSPTPPPEPTTPAASQTPSADPSSQSDALEGWSLEEKVGQLIMVGVDASAPAPASTSAVTEHHVGSIFVAGRSQASSQAIGQTIASITGQAGERGRPMLVATDQEGGEVQVLSGSGFSQIPSALEQSKQSRDQLLASAQQWGQELAEAGVTMNLAPVADLVDIASPKDNGPIGAWGREYGHDAATASSQAIAFAEGMQAAGVIPTYKHFPGLGRVTDNTDTSANVIDRSTSRTGDAAVGVFAEAIAAGAQVIMMSSAVYALIDDSTPAVFSSTIVTDMLRTEMGFTGVVITDDVSAATQVQDWDPGERAILAVRAGCDLVLASAEPSLAAPMAKALVEAAKKDTALAARIDESARRILALKATQPS
ncbi:glycoside hydrolase family 3 N-terminal domain-containing protein [Actinomyces slackii]|nr:glycoside hydrolase family 3 N-terminal domain-containing protein [Actinomyces slackii]